LFLVLIRKFDPNSNFQRDWPELGLIRVEYGLNREKMLFLRAGSGIP